jgi:hypothetical protein
MNIPAATAKTPTDLAREAIADMNCPDDSRSIYKLAAAIIALDARLSCIETYMEKHTPFRELSDPTDPGLSHPCGCEPTPARYPCDPISAPPTKGTVETWPTEELWACLKLLARGFYPEALNPELVMVDKSTWQEVQARAKALFPDRTL